MSQTAGFLISLGQALATMGLYDDGHPARERAVDASFDQLLGVLATTPCAEFSFLDTETVVGGRVVGELQAWDWAGRFSAAKIQRIEIDADVTRDGFLRFLDEVWRQLNGKGVGTAFANHLVRPAARFGALGVVRPVGAAGPDRDPSGATPGDPHAVLSLREEVSAVEWVHQEAVGTGSFPMHEVEAVVRSLATTMRAERRLFLPLLTLKQYDQYTTTHACNVAVLSMGLAERLGLSRTEVRSFGIAGLLHDIGKVAIPRELLIKPGRYTDEERLVIQRHPVEGARIIMERKSGLGLAAVVAYEHHLYLDGGGYPRLSFPRAAHYASRIVHVCDVYDALCTERPYRQAWEPEQSLAYIEQQAGTELDPEITRVFSEMMTDAMIQRAPLEPSPPL